NTEIPQGIPANQRKHGTATMAYQVESGAHVAGSNLATWGSYGLNNWTEDPYTDKIYATGQFVNASVKAKFSPTMDGAGAATARVPVFGECVWNGGAWPEDTDQLSANLDTPSASGWMHRFSLDRHDKQITMAMMDGSARLPPVLGLWNLQWNRAFKMR